MISKRVRLTTFQYLELPHFAVNDYMDATRYPGYQRFAVLMDDFSEQIFIVFLPHVLRVSHLILHNSPQVLDWIEIGLRFQHGDR